MCKQVLHFLNDGNFLPFSACSLPPPPTPTSSRCHHRMSEKQHCDNARTEEGEKITGADGAINVCLRGLWKNLIIPGVFSCRSCERDGTRRAPSAVNSIFAFPTRMTFHPLSTVKKRGPRSCHLRRSLRSLARGNKIYLSSTLIREGGSWHG